MVGLGPHQQESMGSQQQDDFLNLERKRDQEGIVHTTHTSRSHSWVGSHISQEWNNRAMQKEIDHLKKELRHARWRQTPSQSDSFSDSEKDGSYRRRSRTPPSDSFLYEKEHRHECRYKSPTRRGLGNDTMSKALNQISKSPFTCKIEGAILPRQFHQPTFTIYNGRTNPVEHVSHFNQRMTVHSKDETLMCKVFPSSLGPVVMRWFDGLRASSIDSFKKLTRSFGSHFIMCTRVPQPINSLLSLSMREGETLKTHSDRYWEMFNEIDGDFDDVAISTFKVGLPTEHSLRKFLTGKLVTNVCQLMDRINKYKKVEED